MFKKSRPSEDITVVRIQGTTGPYKVPPAFVMPVTVYKELLVDCMATLELLAKLLWGTVCRINFFMVEVGRE